MFSATIKFVTKCTAPATPIREGLLHVSNNLQTKSYSSVLTLNQYTLKQSYLANIKIYNAGIIKDHVEDYETLKLFNELENHIINKDKSKAIECIKAFIRNEDGIYNADYGKSKQQLGDLLYSHRKSLKITPLDVLEKIGFEKKELINMGVLETTLLKTKTCVSSTVFEILVMDTLPIKYSDIQKVYYCQDGAVKIKCINLTGQFNHDFVVEFKDEKGQIVRIAFDSKVQKFDTCLANLEARGLKYQVLTVGNISENEIKKNSAYYKAIANFGNENNIFYGASVSKKKANLNQTNEVESEEPEDLMSSLVVATMFINTDDISENLSRKNIKVEPKCNDDEVD